MSPILVAIKSEQADEVERLLDQDVGWVKEADGRGLTPLHWAVDSGNLEIVRILVTKGSDINAKSTDGISPIHWAVHYGSQEIISCLIEQGADLNSRTKTGQTPLHWAVYRDVLLGQDDQLAVINLLIKNGSDVGVRDDLGRTALDCAKEYDHNSENVIRALTPD